MRYFSAFSLAVGVLLFCLIAATQPAVSQYESLPAIESLANNGEGVVVNGCFYPVITEWFTIRGLNDILPSPGPDSFYRFIALRGRYADGNTTFEFMSGGDALFGGYFPSGKDRENFEFREEYGLDDSSPGFGVSVFVSGSVRLGVTYVVLPAEPLVEIVNQ